MANESKSRPQRSGGRHRPLDRSGDQAALAKKIMEVDKDILRLLMRRYNLLEKLKQNGHMDIQNEKLIRTAWQKEATRVSKDPGLSGNFFSYLQQLTFRPRPSDRERDGENQDDHHQLAFNLAPPKKPINASLIAPFADWATYAWLYMASASGSAMRLDPCLQNDGQIDFIKALVQMGGAVSRDDAAILTRTFSPLGTPDRVLNTGASEWAFFLLLAHYLGRPSRVKFTGSPSMRLNEFSSIRHFLPQLHARLITLIPKIDSLPARLESAGILPPGVSIVPELPAMFAEALILAAPFYPAPFSVDLAPHPAREEVRSHVLPLLEKCGAVFSLQGNIVRIEPSVLVLPESPRLPMDPELAAFLLGFAYPLGGKVTIKGDWPDWPAERRFLEAQPFGWRQRDGEMCAESGSLISSYHLSHENREPEWAIPFKAAIAACVALRGGVATVAEELWSDVNLSHFLQAAGLELSSEGTITSEKNGNTDCWNAPSPAWTLAFALAACARHGVSGWSLGNPGEIRELWPAFWIFYNSLPDPRIQRTQARQEEKSPPRRRIHTSVRAVLPEMNDD